jgi:hypothetical protein
MNITADIIKEAINIFLEYFGLINPPNAPPINTNPLHKIAITLAYGFMSNLYR